MINMKLLICIVGIALSGFVQATPIRITVSGSITDSYDLNGTIFGFGPGYGNLTGKSVAQQFTYDTSTVVHDSTNGIDPSNAVYVSNDHLGSWITVRTLIEGIALSELAETTTGPNAYLNNIDSLSLYNHYDPATGQDFKDIFQVDQVSLNILDDAAGTIYRNSQSLLHIERMGDLISGLDLNQKFGLNIFAEYFNGFGEVRKSIVKVSPSGSNTLSEGFLSYAAHTVKFEDATASIPEPATLALLGVGIAGISYQNSRKRNKSL